MNVWQFLKRRIHCYGEQIAFSKDKTTYSDLIALVENKKDGQRKIPIIAKGETRQEQGCFRPP